jgi:twitching motility two-component system response regulator PilG
MQDDKQLREGEVGLSGGPAGSAHEQARIVAATQMAKAGDTEGARLAFEAICTDNNDCEVGWLWLASLVDDAETGLDCLREVLRINPQNKTALAWLAKAQTPEPKPGLRVVPRCPLCRTSWSEEMRICHSCHALLDLSSPKAFAANEEVNRKVMETAVERLRATTEIPPFDREFYLAVAMFNLLRSSDGLRQLKRAAKLNPEDRRLAGGEVIRKFSKRRAVVVIDDSATVREVMARTIEKAGYMAVQAASGAEGLAAIQVNKPAMVLLDVAMGEMDGYSVCKSIRADAATKALPVVLVSTKDSMFDRAKGRMAGANDYLGKPFQPEEIVKMLKKYAGGK